MVNCCLSANAWWIDHRQKKKLKIHGAYIYQKLNQNKTLTRGMSWSPRGRMTNISQVIALSINKKKRERCWKSEFLTFSHRCKVLQESGSPENHFLLLTSLMSNLVQDQFHYKINTSRPIKKRLLIILVVILIIMILIIITLTLVEEVHHGWPSLVETDGRQLVEPGRQLGFQQLRHEEGWEVRVRGQALELGLGLECWCWRVQPQKHWRPKGPAVLTAWATVDVAVVEPSFVPAFVHVWCIQSHF